MNKKIKVLGAACTTVAMFGMSKNVSASTGDTFDSGIVRKDTYHITDKDPYTEECVDTINITSLTGKTVQIWSFCDYTQMKLTVYFEACEEDEGIKKFTFAIQFIGVTN